MKTILSLLLISFFSFSANAEDPKTVPPQTSDETIALEHFKDDATKLLTGTWQFTMMDIKVNMEFKPNGDFSSINQNGEKFTGHWVIKPNTFVVLITIDPIKNDDANDSPSSILPPPPGDLKTEFLLYAPGVLINPYTHAYKIRK